MSPIAPLDHRVHSALAAHPHLHREKLRFETVERCVVLRGTVGSYYQKQMAQETLRRVEGVEQVENHLEVKWA